jgi:hypothetical protein
MELSTYLCTICSVDKLYKEEILFIRLKSRPRRIEKAREWHSGIRLVCKECVKRMGEFLEEENATGCG